MRHGQRQTAIAENTFLAQRGIDSPWDQAGCELAAEVLRSSGRLRLRANGSSMLPAIWPGDVLTIVRADAQEISIGDVVLFGRDGRLTAHRVIGSVETDARPSWTTRGDSLPTADHPELASDKILGRVVSVERGGRDLPPAQTPMGRIVARLCAHSDLAMRVVLKVRGTWVDSRRG